MQICESESLGDFSAMPLRDDNPSSVDLLGFDDIVTAIESTITRSSPSTHNGWYKRTMGWWQDHGTWPSEKKARITIRRNCCLR